MIQYWAKYEEKFSNFEVDILLDLVFNGWESWDGIFNTYWFGNVSNLIHGNSKMPFDGIE